MKSLHKVCVLAAGLLFANIVAAVEYTGLQNANLHPPGKLMQGDIDLWSKKRVNTEHGLRFEHVQGVSAARFEIRPTDEKISDGYRAELRDPYVASPHEEVWYRFRTLIPGRLLEDPDLSIVLAQWHDKKTQGLPAARPPLALRLVRGTLRVTLWNDQVIAEQGVTGVGKFVYESREFPLDQWIEFVFGVKWSPDETGTLRMWMDDDLVVEYTGAISYTHDVFGPYFKLGVYTVHDFKFPLYVYHSDYRRAASESALREQ